jgi:peptidoglycan/LPS O-acetylase OafA/YrhL
MKYLTLDKTDKIISLDTAKAVGILFIILTHLNQVLKIDKYFLNPRPLYYLIERIFYVLGHYGVSLFLVASGFGLTFSLLKKGTDNWRQWYVKHLLKLFLLFWISYAFFFILFRYGHRFWTVFPHIPISLKEFVTTSLGIQACFGFFGGRINQVYWFNTLILSLYFIFPLLFLWLRTCRFQKSAILFIASFVSGLITIKYSLKIYRFLFAPHLFEFSFGIVVAYWYSQQDVVNSICNGLRRWLPFSAAVGIFGLYFLIRGDTLTVLLVTLSGPLLFWGILVFTQNFSGRHLLAKLFHLVAQYSHALYLFHLPFLSMYSRFHIRPLLFLPMYGVVIMSCVLLGQIMLVRTSKLLKRIIPQYV